MTSPIDLAELVLELYEREQDEYILQRFVEYIATGDLDAEEEVFDLVARRNV